LREGIYILLATKKGRVEEKVIGEKRRWRSFTFAFPGTQFPMSPVFGEEGQCEGRVYDYIYFFSSI